MTMTQHIASDEVLLRHSSGRLSAAHALVLDCHLEMSSEARSRFSDMEALGGLLLEELPMAAVGDDLFEKTLARLNQPFAAPRPVPNYDHQRLAMGVEIPMPLRHRQIGNWRWMGPGMRFARVEMPEDPTINLVLLRIAAGQRMPEHGHSGKELTLILKGAFSDESGRYTVGDLAEEDGETEHRPIVDADGECICLASIEGPMRPHGWAARLFQPFIGL